MSGSLRLSNLPYERWLAAVLDPRARIAFPYAAYTPAQRSVFHSGERVLDIHLIWLVVKGEFPGMVDGREVALRPGSLLWIPPDIRHRFDVPAGVGTFGLRLQLE